MLPPGLVRITTVAALLGVTRQTVKSWCNRLAIPMFRAPVLHGPDDSAPKVQQGPLYVAVAATARLLDAALPGMANQAERKTRQLRLQKEARRLRRSTEHVRNRVSRV